MSWTPSPGSPLTTAELDVLKRIAEGHTDRRIAHDRGVSEGTISHLVRSAARRLGGISRTHTVILAHRRGELPLHCGWTNDPPEATP